MSDQMCKYLFFLLIFVILCTFSTCHQITPNAIRMKLEIADLNINSRRKTNALQNLKDGDVITYNPGTKCPPFQLFTLGRKLGMFMYPDSVGDRSLLVHVFDPNSAFLESLWSSDASLRPLVSQNSTLNRMYLFIPLQANANEEYGAQWMRDRMLSVAKQGNNLAILSDFDELFKFSVEPFSKLGNYLPVVFRQWQCVDHNCGLDQVFIQKTNSSDLNYPVVKKRLDARYDWLPSPPAVFQSKMLLLHYIEDKCETVHTVKGLVALVLYSKTCSYYQQIKNMQNSGALAVVIMADKNQSVFDMWCDGPACMDLSIPASVIPYDETLISNSMMAVMYQNTPSENFFMAVDRFGSLSEVGWFLYPSMDFLVWQAKWFDYKKELETKLLPDRLTVEIFENQTMQGQTWVKVNVTLPPFSELKQYKQIYLDMSLSCPGKHDEDCAHWDHTVNLYICCDSTSSLCDMELGRWITPFRRRIGRWLSDISPLLPLMANQTCVFTMKTAAWAMPWVPSLKIHFQQKQGQGSLYPAEAAVLYQPGATFDKNYNSHFKPYLFAVPDDVKKVMIYSVITGHGSDDNGCGEFCITSHHFQVNSVLNNITFSSAGSPFGCADAVSTGVEPNEHGTWLYGRDGWCDGRNVFPWLLDVTDQLQTNTHNLMNIIHYFGLFEGKDPNPQHNPGIMIFYSYIVYYRAL